MYPSFTYTIFFIGLFFWNSNSLLQAQKCEQASETDIETVAETMPTTPSTNPMEETPKRTTYPFVSEQTKLPSKQSKRSKKREQQFWKRQQRLRKKGCPATRF